MEAKPVKPKTKAQLDKMTKDQVEKYRVKFIQQRILNKESTRYIKELELYRNIRYKDDVIARFDRWNVKKDDVKNVDKDEREMLKFICDVIFKMGKEKYYELSIANDKKELGELQFIKGL